MPDSYSLAYHFKEQSISYPLRYIPSQSLRRKSPTIFALPLDKTHYNIISLFWVCRSITLKIWNIQGFLMLLPTGVVHKELCVNIYKEVEITVEKNQWLQRVLFSKLFVFQVRILERKDYVIELIYQNWIYLPSTAMFGINIWMYTLNPAR